MNRAITGIIVVGLLALTTHAQLITTTQSTAFNVITPNNSVSCAYTTGAHATNSYSREYMPYSQGLFGPFFLWGVDVGVQVAISGNGTQEVILNLYSNSTPGVLGGSLTLLTSESYFIADTSLTTVPLRLSSGIPAFVPDGTNSLVVELVTPDGAAGNNQFLIGSNAMGESGPSYIQSTCQPGGPMPFSALGFPGVNIVLDVVLDSTVQIPVIPRQGTDEGLLLQTGTAGNPTPASSKTADATNNDILTMELTNPNMMFSGYPYVVILQLATTGGAFIDVAGGFGPIWLSTAAGVTTGAYGNDPSGPVGIPPLLGNGDTRMVVLQPVLAGFDVCVQGLSLAGSVAANGVYASSNHHIITLL